MRFILSLLVNGILVFLIADFLDGISVDTLVTAIITGVVLGLVNFFIRPVIKLLTLPITLITLGLFLLVINGLMVLLVDKIVGGFEVDGLWPAILFAILLSIANGILDMFSKD